MIALAGSGSVRWVGAHVVSVVRKRRHQGRRVDRGHHCWTFSPMPWPSRVPRCASVSSLSTTGSSTMPSRRSACRSSIVPRCQAWSPLSSPACRQGRPTWDAAGGRARRPFFDPLGGDAGISDAVVWLLVWCTPGARISRGARGCRRPRRCSPGRSGVLRSHHAIGGRSEAGLQALCGRARRRDAPSVLAGR
jgi:hypothetical protein